MENLTNSDNFQTCSTIVLYVYSLDIETHKGVLKVGQTSTKQNLNEEDLKDNSKVLRELAKKRIMQQIGTAGLSGNMQLKHALVAYTTDKFGNKLPITDTIVHDCFARSGVKKKKFSGANEWFHITEEDFFAALEALKNGKNSFHKNDQEKVSIWLRKEQLEAIQKTKNYFKKSSNMLWDAKMRFGKTITALQLIKELDFKSTVIITHRPEVETSWKDDFNKIFYEKNTKYTFYSKNLGEDISNDSFLTEFSSGKHIICFLSIQNLRGSEEVGGKFEKNNEIFNHDWDFIIIDEAHEGTKTKLGENVIKALEKKDTKKLHLSGTPFNLYDDFTPEATYSWTYLDEQKAKLNWDKDNFGEPNPYAVLPKMNIYTYNLGDLYSDYYDSNLSFRFKDFFEVDNNKKFIHEEDVRSFIKLLMKEDENSNYPFSKQEYRDNFRHSLWVLPGVKEAEALSTILKEYFEESSLNFKVVNVAGAGDDNEGVKNALKMVKEAIGNDPSATYTITLTCGRLTTGVSVPAWTCCLMLAGSSMVQASSYLQTIFRVQTPAVIGGKQKENCFVFDFAPDRTLKAVATVIENIEKNKSNAIKTIGYNIVNDESLLNDYFFYCPVISIQGSKMVRYDSNSLIEQLNAARIERVIRSGFEDFRIYDLKELLSIDDLNWKDFEALKRKIGKTGKLSKNDTILINNQNLDNPTEDKKSESNVSTITKVDKEKNRRKNDAIAILRGISIRMPLILYGANLLDNEEITIHNFADKVDDLSWKEFMPSGVSKEEFKKYIKYYDNNIFRAAGRRIYEMVKQADSFDIEERITLIGQIFENFRNPDRETVLTPWSAVNMHLNEAIGGYSFYDKDYIKIIEEPEFKEVEEVTAKVFYKDSNILEINSKSGLYALYTAYSIYRARKNELKVDSKEERKALWKKVLDENIFLICKTPMAKSIAERTLAGFTKAKVNSRYFEDIVNQLKNKNENFIKKVKSKNYWKKGEGEMKFDAVIGNPPYQIETEHKNNFKPPIYHLFIDTSMEISPRGTLIHPAKFLFRAGDTPKDWDDKILNNEHFKVIKFFTNSSALFNNVIIKGSSRNRWDFIFINRKR